MEKFTVHTGRALPLRRSNVDTDQIIPAEYLKRITRHGYEDALFAAWRTDPSFILNDPAYAGVTVLVAGPDFGAAHLDCVRRLRQVGRPGPAPGVGRMRGRVNADDALGRDQGADGHAGETRFNIEIFSKLLH